MSMCFGPPSFILASLLFGRADLLLHANSFLARRKRSLCFLRMNVLSRLGTQIVILLSLLRLMQGRPDLGRALNQVGVIGSLEGSPLTLLLAFRLGPQCTVEPRCHGSFLVGSTQPVWTPLRVRSLAMASPYGHRWSLVHCPCLSRLRSHSSWLMLVRSLHGHGFAVRSGTITTSFLGFTLHGGVLRQLIYSSGSS